MGGSLIIIIEVGRTISGDFFIEFVEEKVMENIEEFTCGFKLWGLNGFAFVKGDGDGVDFELERIASSFQPEARKAAARCASI